MPLFNGVWQDQPAEPVAWTTQYHGGRGFFTTLGSPEDLNDANFKRLLDNGISWALDKPLPAAGSVGQH